jgi:gliding motility-associated-like protein
MYKYILSAILLFSLAHTTKAQCNNDGVIVNEFSNGQSGGAKEYVELLVVGCPGSSIDIQNFRIDDNNGEFSNGPNSGEGIASGHICLSDNQWSNIPVGSIIVIYNDDDKNINFGNGANQIADDPTDSDNDLVYVLPVNSSLLGGSDSKPSTSNSTYGSCGNSSQTWTTIGLRNGGDAMQTRKSDESFFHGVSYGASGIKSSNDGLHFPGSGSGQAYFFENTVDDDFRNVANFANRSATNSTATTDESPGIANSANNQSFIDYLRTVQPETVTITEGTKNCSSVELIANDFCAYEWTKTPSSTVISTSKTHTALSSGTYQVKVTTALGCTYTKTHDVTISSANVSLSTPGIICDNTTFTATVTGPDAAGSSVSWSSTGNETNDNGLSEDYKFNGSGTITATVTTSGGCEVTLTQTIDPNSNNATLSLNPNPICEGSTTVATVTNVATGSNPITYTNWTIESGGINQSNDGGSTETFFITAAPAKISVTVVDGNGCSADLDATPNFQSTLAAPATTDINICLNQSPIPITPNSTQHYWLAGDSTLIGNTPPTYSTASVLDTTFYVYQNNGGCPGDTAALNVKVNDLPSAILRVEPSTICLGDSVLAYLINKQNIQTVDWSNTHYEYGQGTDSAIYYSPTDGSFTITAILTSADNCSQTISKDASVNPTLNTPNVTDFDICSDATLPDFSNGGSYYYQNEDKTLTFTAKPDFSGYTQLDTVIHAFSFDGTNSCHSDTVSLHLVIRPKAPQPVASDRTYCQFETASQLTPNTNQFVWYSESGTALAQAPTPQTNSVGITKYVVKDSTNQCYSEADTATIIIVAKPSNIAIDTLRYCANASATKLTPNGSTFYWQNSSTNFGNNAPTPNTTTVGEQKFLVYEEVNGCKSDETEIVVIVKEQPTFQQDSGYTFCTENTFYNLEPSADSVKWFDNNNAPIPAPSIDLNFVQNIHFSYRVELDGCIGPISNITVDVANQPSNPMDANLTYCTENSSISLQPNTASIQWFDINSNRLPNAPNLDLNNQNSYAYKIVDTNYHCSSDTAFIDVVVKQSGITPAGSHNVYCEANIVSTASVGGSNIAWMDKNRSPIASAPTVDLNIPGSFEYFFTDTLNQCPTDTNAYTFVVNPRPATPRDTVINQCEGSDPILLTPAGPGYIWYDGATTADSIYTDPSINGNKTYQYSFIDINTCESLKATVEVRIGQKSTDPVIPTPQEFCLNSTGKLSPENNNIIWYSDTTNHVYSILSPNTNTSTANDSIFYAASIASGCPSDIVSVTARVLPKPTLPSFGNLMLCVGDANYTPNYNATDITWHQTTTTNTGKSTPFTSSTSTADSLVYFYYKNENTCSSDTLSYYVKINDLPTQPSAITASVCEGDYFLLSQESMPNRRVYTFNNGDIFSPIGDTNIVAKLEYTNYVIDVYNTSTGCSNSFNGTINIKQVTPITLPPSDVCERSGIEFSTATNGYDAVDWTTTTGINLNQAYNVLFISKADSGKHYYTVYTNGCAYSDSVIISVLDTPTVQFDALPFICPDSSTTLNIATKTSTGLLDIEYNYNQTGLNSKQESIPFLNLNYGDEILITSIADDHCTSQIDISLNTNNHPWPRVNLNQLRYEICNDSVMVPLSFEGTPNYTVDVVSTNNVFIFTATQDTLLYFNTPDTYTIDSIADNNCIRDTTITFEIVSPLSQEPDFVFSDTILCYGINLDFMILNLDPAANYEYSFDGSNFATYNSPVTYSPTAGNCYDLTVNVAKATCNVQYTIDTAFCALEAVIADYQSFETIDEESQILLYTNTSQNYDSLYWFSSIGQNDVNQESFYFDFPLDYDSISVCLEASAKNTCFDTVCANVVRPIETKIYVPSAFTPNGDAHNEGFKPSIFGEILRYEFEIFNRWGEKIYQTEDIHETWDGVYKGVIVPNGVYAWKLRYFNYSVYNQEMHGTVTIIR